MKKFCYKCGKLTENLENGLCENCRKDKNVVKVKLVLCTKCGKIKEGKVWKSKSIESFVKKRLKAKEINFEKRIAKTPKGIVNFEIKLEKVICLHCLKLASGYYESVMQLRGFSESEIEKILSKIKEPFFTKHIKRGVDIYFLRKPVAEKIARKVKKMFKNIEVKKSFELVTVKNGQRVYRNYVSVRKNEKKRTANRRGGNSKNKIT